jgi:cytochrome b6-f complex iron-sulfur subunit
MATMMMSGMAAQRAVFQTRKPAAAKPARAAVVVRSSAVAAEDVPTPEKRTIMNLLLAGAIGLPVAGLAGPYALFFVPKS